MAKEPIKKYAIETQYVAGIAQYPYAKGKGKPQVVVLHDTGNDKSKISGEIAWMSRNWSSAFVHAWADADHIIETANTDFLCWGAGPKVNTIALQIELVHEHDKTRFLKSIDRWIFWAAFQCYWYGIKPTDATDDGSGTIWTHAAVSKFLGGTDHVDPMPYVTERSKKLTGKAITWAQIFSKLVEYHKVLTAGGDTRKVLMIGETAAKAAPKAKAPVKAKPKAAKTHTVKKGETLWSISQQHKLTVDALKKLNGLTNNNLTIGQKLKLEAAAAAAKPKAKAPAKTTLTPARISKEQALQFVKNSVGQYYDYDGAFKFQCYDYANAYWHALYKHGFTGMQAAEIHRDNKAILAKEATVYVKTANNRPQPLDVLLFDWTPDEHEDFGHVAVCLEAGQNGMTVVEQNADGHADKPANKRSCNYNGVTHFIRPTFK